MLQRKAEQTSLLPDAPPPRAQELCMNSWLQGRQEGKILPAMFLMHPTAVI